MHKLSLCDDLLAQVLAIAAQHKAQSVAEVTVQCGALSGVEPMLLESAFAMITAGTLAQNAQLIIQPTRVLVYCASCGLQSEVAANRLLCPVCLAQDTQLLSGDELILASVALDCVGVA